MKRLEDLRLGNLNLSFECGWCAHAGVLDGAKLWRWFAVHMWKSDGASVPEHVRCSVCRRRPTKLTPTTDAPTADPFPVNEDGWQRIIRRLRG
jgi:hypothetical protein